MRNEIKEHEMYNRMVNGLKYPPKTLYIVYFLIIIPTEVYLIGQNSKFSTYGLSTSGMMQSILTVIITSTRINEHNHRVKSTLFRFLGPEMYFRAFPKRIRLAISTIEDEKSNQLFVFVRMLNRCDKYSVNFKM